MVLNVASLLDCGLVFQVLFEIAAVELVFLHHHKDNSLSTNLSLDM